MEVDVIGIEAYKKTMETMKMRKMLIGLMLAMVILTGCGVFDGLPSVCDDKTEPSILCDTAEKNGIRLESVGFGLIAANAILINQEAYTKGQAVEVLSEMRSIFDNPVSYVFAKTKMNEAALKYPGLVGITGAFLSAFSETKIMLNKDRQIMITFLDNRISDLGD